MVTSKTLPGQTKVKSTSSSDSSSEVLVEPNPNLRCVAEETDTRLWLHVKKTQLFQYTNHVTRHRYL